MKKLLLLPMTLATLVLSSPAYAELYIVPGDDLAKITASAKADGWTVFMDRVISVEIESDEAALGLTGKFPAVLLSFEPEDPGDYEAFENKVVLLKPMSSGYMVIHVVDSPDKYLMDQFYAVAKAEDAERLIAKARAVTGEDHDDCGRTKNGYVKMNWPVGEDDRPAEYFLVYKKQTYRLIANSSVIGFGGSEGLYVSNNGETVAFISTEGSGAFPTLRVFTRIGTAAGPAYKEIEVDQR